ncbi:MAG TPA: MFS transporter [Polyangiales bacterium]|nr:MFS transporter [Polyangiales bacterium]
MRTLSSPSEESPVPTATEEDTSPLAPLRNPDFRNRVLSSLLSNTGTWMQDTAATWLMTSLTTSALLVALMQTAASLPVLLLGLPAGALADILDRRKLLIFWQAWMLGAALLLSVFGVAGTLGPFSLLTLTFLLNVGAAMNNPAWQAIVPELVPRTQLSQAIALNSAVFNMARVIGPAFGGGMLAAFATARGGAAAVFLVNSLSFVFVMFALYRWKRKTLRTSQLPAERFIGSLQAGIRYVRHAPELHGVLIRTFLMTSCASAVWALLAIVARSDLQGGAFGYGMLNACLGVGAVFGAALLPRVRLRLSANAIVTAAGLAFAATLLTLAFVHRVELVCLSLLLAGFAWTSTTATFNVAVQTVVPPWVQARALGAYQMVFQGGLAIGSAVWGLVASHTSTPVSLSAAAAGLLIGVPLTRRFRVRHPELNLLSLAASGRARSVPVLPVEPKPEAGPVLISVAYDVDPDNAEEFAKAIDALKEIRLRDGALRWGLFRDPADPSRYVETFLVDSWSEYLRQRERFTMEDLLVRERVYALHRGAIPPPITRMIYTPTG